MDVKELALFLGLTEAEAAMLKERGDQLGLDPVSGQINLLKRRKKEKSENGDTWVSTYSFQVGIEGFRLIAERSGNYDGQDPIEFVVQRNNEIYRTDVTMATDVPIAAVARVYRKGISRPFVGTAHYRDYVGTSYDGSITSMWKKWTIMLAKCAEAAAFRKGFPELGIGGVYEKAELSAELPDETNDTDTQSPQGQGKEPPWVKHERKLVADKAVSSETAATTVPAESETRQEKKDVPAEKKEGSKRADPAQIRAIQMLSKNRGINYSTEALAALSFEEAAAQIKSLNAERKEAAQ